MLKARLHLMMQDPVTARPAAAPDPREPHLAPSASSGHAHPPATPDRLLGSIWHEPGSDGGGRTPWPPGS